MGRRRFKTTSPLIRLNGYKSRKERKGVTPNLEPWLFTDVWMEQRSDWLSARESEGKILQLIGSVINVIYV